MYQQKREQSECLQASNNSWRIMNTCQLYKPKCDTPYDKIYDQIDGFVQSCGARPTNDISIEFEIQWNFVILLFIIYQADHNEIAHVTTV